MGAMWEPNPSDHGGTARLRVRSIQPEGPVTVLSAEPGVAFRLATRPDRSSARRWCQVMRRIDRVEIDCTSDRPRAVVHGVGHRRQTVMSVAVGTALGLGLLGVPVVLEMGGR